MEARVEHAATAQDSHQDSEGLEGGKIFHVVGDQAAEEDAGGADERGHLWNEEGIQAEWTVSLMAARDTQGENDTSGELLAPGCTL